MEEAGTTRFSPKQNEAIALLARGCTYDQAAEGASVNKYTVAKWMKSPDFRAAVDLVSQKAIAKREKTIEAKMSQLELKALETLEDLMKNATKDADRINAAKAVLAHQNGRKVESSASDVVNFLGMSLPGSPKMENMITGDVANADD